ncbi:MAG: hypothetical protein ABR906_07200, partial [Terracidiphilus sp.]
TRLAAQPVRHTTHPADAGTTPARFAMILDRRRNRKKQTSSQSMLNPVPKPLFAIAAYLHIGRFGQ